MKSIIDLVGANERILPASHVSWIKGQLAQNPPASRLEEILEHLTALVSSHEEEPLEEDDDPLGEAPELTLVGGSSND